MSAVYIANNPFNFNFINVDEITNNTILSFGKTQLGYVVNMSTCIQYSDCFSPGVVPVVRSLVADDVLNDTLSSILGIKLRQVENPIGAVNSDDIVFIYDGVKEVDGKMETTWLILRNELI